MLPAARDAMIDFHTSGLLGAAPGAHRVTIGGRPAEGRFRRTLGGRGAAYAAAIPVTPFRGAARERPPVIRPKRRRAAIAAPGPAARRQVRAAPSAPRGGRTRERAAREQRRALRRAHDALAGASSRAKHRDRPRTSSLPQCRLRGPSQAQLGRVFAAQELRQLRDRKLQSGVERAERGVARAGLVETHLIDQLLEHDRVVGI